MRRLMSKSEPPIDLVSWAKKLVSNSIIVTLTF